MRVLIISDVTGYMRGGVPTETVQLVRGLAARGHEVALAGDVLPAGAEAATLLPITLPVSGALAGQVRAALDTFRPDVVHVMAMSSRGTLQIAPMLRGRRWLMTCHSVPPQERKLPGLHDSERLHYGVRWLRYLANQLAWRWVLRRGVVPRVVVHSRVMQEIVTRYGQAADGCVLVPLGCALDSWKLDAPLAPRGPAPRIVTMAGLAHTKGQHDGIAAVAALALEFPGITYRLIGEVRDRSYLRHLEQLIERHGLQGRVAITPNLSHAEKERALGEADLYLQPSHEEGFCLAYIETATMVARLVGTDTGAIAAIGEGDAGMRTVPVRGVPQMADAMRELLRAPLPPELMAQRRARLAEAYGWSRYLDAHEALYGREEGALRRAEAPAPHGGAVSSRAAS